MPDPSVLDIIGHPLHRRALTRVKAAGIDLSTVEVPEGETPEDRAARLEAQARGRGRAWRESAGDLADMRFADLKPQQDCDARSRRTPAVTDWLDSDSRNLFLHGPSRRGKTVAAYAVGNEARLRGLWVVGYRMTRLMREYRDRSTAHMAQQVVDEVPLLILDDIGAEHTTEWTAEQLYDLLEQRLNNARLRTVMTTNLTWSWSEKDEKGEPKKGAVPGLVQRYGDRIAKRLVEHARVVRIDGEPLAEPDPF